MSTVKRIDFFKSYLTREANDSLLEFEKRERESGFPIIGKGVQDLLRLLMTTAKPQNILELGTGVGFSAILMALYGKEDIRITTVELKDKNRKRALNNISEWGYEDRIECIPGDAEAVVKSPPVSRGGYDLIFVDCAKAQYARLWESLRTLVRRGGIVVTDDILQNDSVISSRFLLNRRDRTTHKRMREYLYAQLNDKDFTGAVFEIDDGITLLVRNEDE